MRIWLCLLIALVFLSGCISQPAKTDIPSSAECQKIIAELPQVIADNTKEGSRLFYVNKTVDGDTIELEGGQRVRFLEVNTPEKGMKWYAEAKELTNMSTLDGVYLTRDVTDKDKYDRLLRYVFTKDSFVNAELVRAGFATVFIVGNDTKYASLMKCLEDEAKANKRGLWSAVNLYNLNLSVNFDAVGSDLENMNGEFVTIVNTGTEAINLQNWSIKDEATHIYTFPELELATNENLILYTGAGENSELNLYWNSKDPIWNNDGDTAFLFDANGDLIVAISFP
jgi:micrococcal nuclease